MTGTNEQRARELLPCPFCGKTDMDQWPCDWLDGSGANVIRCAHCHGAAPMLAWNRRAALAEPKAGAVPEELLTAWVNGAKWWEFHKTGATMWQSDQQLVYDAAKKKLAAPQAQPVEQDESYLDALDSLWKLVNGDNNHPVYRAFLKFVDTAKLAEQQAQPVEFTENQGKPGKPTEQQGQAVRWPFYMVDETVVVNGVALDEVVTLGKRYADQLTVNKPRAAQVFEALVRIASAANAFYTHPQPAAVDAVPEEVNIRINGRYFLCDLQETTFDDLPLYFARDNAALSAQAAPEAGFDGGIEVGGTRHGTATGQPQEGAS